MPPNELVVRRARQALDLAPVLWSAPDVLKPAELVQAENPVGSQVFFEVVDQLRHECVASMHSEVLDVIDGIVNATAKRPLRPKVSQPRKHAIAVDVAVDPGNVAETGDGSGAHLQRLVSREVQQRVSQPVDIVVPMTPTIVRLIAVGSPVATADSRSSRDAAAGSSYRFVRLTKMSSRITLRVPTPQPRSRNKRLVSSASRRSHSRGL
jgi:hypothetical protein